MATNIDERIVAAKFDASDFEKGVNKTIKKLDELKKSLDLKDATKGVKELAEKTEASTDSMSKSLDKLTERFTTFAGMIKQRILGGLADEVAGVFLKMERSVTSLVKSVSVDQISAGLQKYQSTLTSVRQMVNAGYNQETVYTSLERLRTYTDETSYSFEQMADAMSKMVAAGVNLDQASKNVEGIANACANAGINAQEAQRAFFNLSQAFTKGKLEYTDYKSLELLNMTNEEFTKQCMEAAAEAGTLTKSVDKLGNTVYKTTNKIDKKVKAGKTVTLKNFTDSLKYDFMNTEAMNKLFGSSYWMEVIDRRELEKLRKELGDEEFEKRFGKIATKAYEAAYEARSFLDVINAVKDAVSSGWANTFEFLFGKLDDAKNFFTGLANGELADVVYKISEYRNAILEFWDDSTNGIESGGGAVFRQTITNITEALGTLLKTFADILPGFKEFDESEGETNSGIQSLSDRLFMATMRIRDFSLRVKEAAEKFREFMNSPAFNKNEGPTRIELLRETFTNLASVLGIAAKVISIALNGISRAFYTLSPIFDGIITLIAKITQPLENLNDDSKVFDNISDSIDNILKVLDPVAKVLGDIIAFLADIAAFFAQMAIDTVTSNLQFFADVIDLIVSAFTGGKSAQMERGEGVLNRMQKDFEGIKEACQSGLTAIKEFFGALLGDLKQLFGLTDDAQKKTENQNGGIFSGLINFFNTNQFVQDAKKWVDQAIIDVGNFVKSIPERVMELGGNIYETLRGLFFKDETKDNGGIVETKTILTPLGEWADQAIKDIKEFIHSIPQRIIEGVGTITNWIDEVFNYWFKPYKSDNSNIQSYKNDGGKWVETDTIFAPRFEQFILNAKMSINKWFDDLPNKIRLAFANVGNFFTRLYNNLDEFLFGKKVRQTISVANGKGGYTIKDVTVRYKRGFSKWLDGFIKEIKKFISNIPEYIKQGIKGAGDIITTITNALFGKSENETVTNKDVEEKIEKPFLGINISNILTTIKEIGTEILNQIARIFTGSEDVDYNMNWFAEQIAKGINWIREKAEIALNWVLEFLGNLPTTISNIFTGEGKDTQEQEKGPIGQAISGFGVSIGKFIENIPNTVLTFIDNTVTEFGKVWDKLYTAIVGETSETSEEIKEDTKESVEVDAISGAAPQLTGWQKFVENIGKTISNIWSELPVWIAKGIEMAIVEIDNLISNIGTWMKGIGVQEAVAEEAGTVVTGTLDEAAKSTEEAKNEEEPALITAIKKVGERIKTLFIETLPSFIQDAFLALGRLGSTIFSNLSTAFSGDIPEDQEDASVKNVGTQVIEFFKEKLPAWFQQAWKDISGVATEIFTGFSTIFTGEEPKGEIQKSANEFGTMIYNTITVTIPNFIKRAFDFIKGLFTKKDPLEENLKLLPDSERAYVSRYVDKMKKDYKNVVEDETGNPESWSFIDGIKEGFLNAFSSIGPAILNGLATALDWIGKIATIIIDALSGKKSIADQVEETYGKEKPELRESLTRIGESLKNFFLDTIPKFIGAAIGALQKEIPKWFSKLFGAMSEAAKEEGDKSKKQNNTDKNLEEATKGAMGVMDIISTVIGSIRTFVAENKDIAELAVVLIALVMIFNALSDLFSVGSMAEGLAEPIKWVAITVAIATIAGILSYIGQIVDENNPTKIENLNNILAKLSDTVKWIAILMGAVAVGKIGDAIGNIASKDGVSILGSISGVFSTLFGGAAFGGGAYLASAGISAAIDTFMTTITDSFTSLASGVGSAVELIEPTIEKLNSMYYKLERAKEAIVKVKDIFAVFMQAFESLYEDAVGKEMTLGSDSNNEIHLEATTDTGNVNKGTNKAELSMNTYIDILKERLELFSHLATFMNELANSFSKFDKIEDFEGTIDELDGLINGKYGSTSGKLQNLFVSILNMLKTVVEGSNFSPELLANQYTTRTAGMITALDIMADTFTIFGTSISNIDEDSLDGLSKMFNLFGELSGAFEDAKDVNVDKPSLLKIFTGDNSLSAVASEIKLFGINMKGFFDQVSLVQGFDNDRIEITKRIITGMIAVLEAISEASSKSTIYDNPDVLKMINPYLPDFGTAVGTFFKNLDEHLPKNMDMDRSNQLASSVQSISTLITSLSGLFRLMQEFDGIDLSEKIDQLFQVFGGDPKYNKNIPELSSIIIAFDNMIRGALLSEEATTNYEEVGKNLAGYLIGGMQTAIDNDPTLRITPVLNLDTAESQLKSLFGIEDFGDVDFSKVAQSAREANSSTDADKVSASALNDKIDEVTSAINNLKDAQTTVDQLTTAFSKLKMYLNKNVLVAEITDDIDERIGLKIDLINNNVSA